MSTKILIIEDDADFKRVLELRLKSIVPDMDLTTFASLDSARKFLQTGAVRDFDLVILDEHLPDGRGIEFLNEGWFEDLAVLSVSSDSTPSIPGEAVLAGARFFLNKLAVKEALFPPLVKGILERNRLQRELSKAKVHSLVIDTVKTLVATLRHEINNPLGAVLGGAYIMRHGGNATPDQIQAAEVVEASGKRIKHVLDELCEAIELEPVTKANQKVFHIPGDAPWDSGDGKTPKK